MAWNTRTIWFYTPVLINENGDSQEVRNGELWTKLHTHCAQADVNKRRVTFNGLNYLGIAKTEKSPATEFLYITKIRAGHDWPHFEDASGIPAPVAADSTEIRNIHEPAYVVPVSRNENEFAIYRTSGGPTPAAIANWMTQVTGIAQQGQSWELIPYLTASAYEKLHHADAVSKLRLKVGAEAIAQLPDGSQGDLTAAMKNASALGEHQASVLLELSLGTVRSASPATDALKRTTDQAAQLASQGASEAKATLKMISEDGSLTTDSVDFIKDRLTARVRIGTKRDRSVSDSEVLFGMNEAIQEFHTSK